MAYNSNKVGMLKEKYPKGTRICVDSKGNDPHPIPSGTEGTVEFVDDIGTVHCKFDNGRSLGLIPDEDSFHIIQPKKEQKIKPDCPLIGENGNIYNLMGIASKTLRNNGISEQAAEMCDKIIHSGSYDEALCIIGEYVNITSVDEETSEEPEINMSI